MKTMRTKQHAWVLFLFFSLSTIAGCTHTYSPPKEPVKGYATTSKIPLTIELCLSDELRAAKWERSHMGDTWVIPLGGALVQNSEVVAREIFSNIVVTNGSNGP